MVESEVVVGVIEGGQLVLPRREVVEVKMPTRIRLREVVGRGLRVHRIRERAVEHGQRADGRLAGEVIDHRTVQLERVEVAARREDVLESCCRIALIEVLDGLAELHLVGGRVPELHLTQVHRHRAQPLLVTGSTGGGRRREHDIGRGVLEYDVLVKLQHEFARPEVGLKVQRRLFHDQLRGHLVRVAAARSPDDRTGPQREAGSGEGGGVTEVSHGVRK